MLQPSGLCLASHRAICSRALLIYDYHILLQVVVSFEVCVCVFVFALSYACSLMGCRGAYSSTAVTAQPSRQPLLRAMSPTPRRVGEAPSRRLRSWWLCPSEGEASTRGTWKEACCPPADQCWVVTMKFWGSAAENRWMKSRFFNQIGLEDSTLLQPCPHVGARPEVPVGSQH